MSFVFMIGVTVSYINLDAEFNFVMSNGEGTVYNYGNNMENSAEVFVQVSEEIRHFLLIPYVEK